MVSLWLVKESYWPFKIEISNEHDFAVYIETHFCIEVSIFATKFTHDDNVIYWLPYIADYIKLTLSHLLGVDVQLIKVK